MSFVWTGELCEFILGQDNANALLSHYDLMDEVKKRGVVPGHVCSDEYPGGTVAVIVLESEPTEQERSVVEEAIASHAGKPPRRVLRGSESFELSAGSRKWVRHTRRVNFPRTLPKVPTVELSTINYDGAADLAVNTVTRDYFDVTVQSKGGKGRYKHTSVDFDWRAFYELD